MTDLVLKNRYEGLDPELAQILLKGEDLIGGTYEDVHEETIKCILHGYFALSMNPYRVYRENSDSFVNVTNFTPSQPIKEKVINWNKIPVDTLIEIEYRGEKHKRYFAYWPLGSSFIHLYDGGKTSKTGQRTSDWEIKKHKIKIIEYPCNCQKEKA